MHEDSWRGIDDARAVMSGYESTVIATVCVGPLVLAVDVGGFAGWAPRTLVSFLARNARVGGRRDNG